MQTEKYKRPKQKIQQVPVHLVQSPNSARSPGMCAKHTLTSVHRVFSCADISIIPVLHWAIHSSVGIQYNYSGSIPCLFFENNTERI